MKEHDRSILSIILDKRIRELGFESLRKFYISRQETIGVSYELFRQVLHSGRIPRAESLLPILRAAQLPDSAIRMLLSRFYPQLAVDGPGSLVVIGPASGAGAGQEAASASGPSPADQEHKTQELSGQGSPAEMADRLCSALSRIPQAGNEIGRAHV